MVANYSNNCVFTFTHIHLVLVHPRPALKDTISPKYFCCFQQIVELIAYLVKKGWIGVPYFFWLKHGENWYQNENTGDDANDYDDGNDLSAFGYIFVAT